MFSETTQWYDLLYSFKDYEKEARTIVKLLREKHPKARTLLDVACGTAEHDRYWAQHYEVDGLDFQEEFLVIARTKNPEGSYFQQDMTDFDLEKKYDVVLCLFSSIGYVKTLDKVTETLKCFREHINEDGLILVEPWFTPDTWRKPGNVYMLTAESEDTKICRMNLGGERQGNLSILNFHYLVGTPEGVQHYTEHHELGLFPIEEMCNAFEEAELQVEYDEQGISGRGLYLANIR